MTMIITVRVLLLFLMLGFTAPISMAQTPIDDSVLFAFPEELRVRAQKISQELRCPICQGQSIAESDALIAKRLRLMVLEELQKGKSDKQVIDAVKQRYGDYIHFKPPFNAGTLLLWFGPFFLFLGMLWLAWRKFGSEQQ